MWHPVGSHSAPRAAPPRNTDSGEWPRRTEAAASARRARVAAALDTAVFTVFGRPVAPSSSGGDPSRSSDGPPLSSPLRASHSSAGALQRLVFGPPSPRRAPPIPPVAPTPPQSPKANSSMRVEKPLLPQEARRRRPLSAPIARADGARLGQALSLGLPPPLVMATTAIANARIAANCSGDAARTAAILGPAPPPPPPQPMYSAFSRDGRFDLQRIASQRQQQQQQQVRRFRAPPLRVAKADADADATRPDSNSEAESSFVVEQSTPYDVFLACRLHALARNRKQSPSQRRRSPRLQQQRQRAAVAGVTPQADAAVTPPAAAADAGGRWLASPRCATCAATAIERVYGAAAAGTVAPLP